MDKESTKRMSRNVSIAYNYIVEAIENGSFEEGQSLREGMVAEQINISRTPIREAFRILTAEGWLEAKQNQGVKVSCWGRKRVQEVYEIRAILEPMLVAMASERLSSKKVDELTQLAHEMCNRMMKTPADLVWRWEANEKFHKDLIRYADHRVMTETIEAITKVPLVKYTLNTYTKEEIEASNQQHIDIIDAIRNKNKELAAALMRVHILHGQKTALKRFDDHAKRGLQNTTIE